MKTINDHCLSVFSLVYKSIAVLFITVFCLLASAPAMAMDHSGEILSDETWFAADNPHYVVGPVTVNEGITLKIEAGVEVYSDGSTWFSIAGTLWADGTADQKIHLSKRYTSRWGGIWFGMRYLNHHTNPTPAGLPFVVLAQAADNE